MCVCVCVCVWRRVCIMHRYIVESVLDCTIGIAIGFISTLMVRGRKILLRSIPTPKLVCLCVSVCVCLYLASFHQYLELGKQIVICGISTADFLFVAIPTLSCFSHSVPTVAGRPSVKTAPRTRALPAGVGRQIRTMRTIHIIPARSSCHRRHPLRPNEPSGPF